MITKNRIDEVANETFNGDEMNPEMMGHDVYVRMSPIRRYSIKAKITKVVKAEPRIIMDAD